MWTFGIPENPGQDCGFKLSFGGGFFCLFSLIGFHLHQYLLSFLLLLSCHWSNRVVNPWLWSRWHCCSAIDWGITGDIVEVGRKLYAFRYFGSIRAAHSHWPFQLICDLVCAPLLLPPPCNNKNCFFSFAMISFACSTSVSILGNKLLELIFRIPVCPFKSF